MKFLVCGLGSIGSRHARILKSFGGHQVNAFRTGKMPLASARGFTPDQIFSNLDDALDSKPDAALVTNPTNLHVETALRIAARGVPLFLEKPLSHNLDDVDRLQEAVTARGLPVLVGFNLAFHPAVTRLQTIMAEERLGRPLAARAHWGTYLPGWHPWEDYRLGYAARSDMGGGAVLTMCHEINYLTSLFGTARCVAAMEIEHKTLGITAEEGLDILIKHTSGVTSSVHLNFFQKPYRRSCEIIGSLGTVFWDFMLPELKIMDDERTETIQLGESYEALLNTSYEEQMRHFIEVARGNIAPRVTLAKGIEDQKLLGVILKEIGR